MNKDLIAIVGVIGALLLGAGFIGQAVSAHGYGSYDLQDSEFRDSHDEMSDIHRQYLNNEISSDEFRERMNDESLYADMPCHGYGWFGMMGSSMMGWG